MRPPPGPGLAESGHPTSAYTPGVTRSHFRREPVRGEIWGAYASSTLRVLEIALPYAGPHASPIIREDISFIIDNNNARKLQKRPCVVLASDPAGGTVDVVAFTTLKGAASVGELNGHLAHFLVAVGTTPGWPIPEAWVLETEPAWTNTPQYAVACVLRLPRGQLVERWGSRGVFPSCSEPALERLENVCKYRLVTYDQAPTREQRAQWDLQYLVEREQRIPGPFQVYSLIAQARNHHPSATALPQPASEIAYPAVNPPASTWEADFGATNALRAALGAQMAVAALAPHPRAVAPTHGRSHSEPAALHPQALGALPPDVRQLLPVWTVASNRAAPSGRMIPQPMAPHAPASHGSGWPERVFALPQAAVSAAFAHTPRHGRSHSAPAAGAFQLASPSAPFAGPGMAPQFAPYSAAFAGIAPQPIRLGSGMPPPGVARPVHVNDAMRLQLAAAMGLPPPFHGHRF